MRRRRWAGIFGLAVLVLVWWIATDVLALPGSFLRHFSPLEALASLVQLTTHTDLPVHIMVSLRRVLLACFSLF